MTMKERTAADHRERLNRVLLHIAEHIDQPLSLETLADVACFSPFHFHRIFTAHVGETLNDHVRRLRLERAAQRLCQTNDPVTAIALAAGYETPASFTRAFRDRFTMSPSEFRGQRVANPPRAEHPATKEIGIMTPEMRKLPETRVLYVRKTGAYSEAAAAAWSVLMGFAYKNRLLTRDTLAIGIGHDNPDITPEEKLRYDACITFTGSVPAANEVGIQTIAGGRYAVFLHKGAYTGLAETYRSIFAGWLPGSGCDLRECPCFEVYLNRDPRRTKPENLRTEIWLPVE